MGRSVDMDGDIIVVLFKRLGVRYYLFNPTEGNLIAGKLLRQFLQVGFDPIHSFTQVDWQRSLWLEAKFGFIPFFLTDRLWKGV